MRRHGVRDVPMRVVSWGFGPLDERMRRSPIVETLEPCDEDLCRRIAQQDGGAFDLLVERYQERAYRIAWSVVRDREDAKDCSQEAFIRLHESAGSFAGQAKFSTWFYRILVNCCLDHHRKRGGGVVAARGGRWRACASHDTHIPSSSSHFPLNPNFFFVYFSPQEPVVEGR